MRDLTNLVNLTWPKQNITKTETIANIRDVFSPHAHAYVDRFGRQSGWLKMQGMKMQDIKLQDMKLQDKIVLGLHYITKSVQLFIVVIFLGTNTIKHCL